jgi:hypothetical protein
VERKLHNEELCDLYSLLGIIRIVKSRRMSMDGGEEEGVSVVGGKTTGKETTRKIKM